MQYTTLATDYDGTIAMAGRVTETTVQALRDARAAGIRLLMVTGRELDDLYRNFPHCDMFERIVAENGALLHNPQDRTSRTLCPPPPAALLHALTELKIPFSAGNSIVAADETHKHAVLEVISRLGIEWHIILNKDSLMILPSDVTKASGLTAALEELGIPAEKVVGVGDAENDQAFLRMCGYAAAVANALPAVKAIAGFVSDHPAGEGVTDLLRLWMQNSLPARTAVGRALPAGKRNSASLS